MKQIVLLAVSLVVTFALRTNAENASPAAPPTVKDTIAAAQTAPAPPQSKRADSAKPSSPQSVPAPHVLRMFAQFQYDSVLNLLPSGDSIRAAGNYVAMGVDSFTGDITVIFLDSEGNPAKAVVPASRLIPRVRIASVTNVRPAPGANRPEKPPVDQRGRTWFMIETAAKSAFYYGSSYATVFHNANGSVIAGATLLTLGGTLFGSYAFTNGMDLGYGKTGLMNYGATLIGGYYPQLISTCLNNATSINDRYKHYDTMYVPVPFGSPSQTTITESYSSPTATDYVKAWSSMIGFPLGVYLGSRLRIVDNDDAGKVTLMAYFSQSFGFLIGFGAPLYFIDPDHDTRSYWGASSALSMCLLPGGFYAGYLLAENKRISTGRGTLPWVTGTMGTLTGIGVTSLFEPDLGSDMATIRLYASMGFIGYGAGTWLALTYHPDVDYTFWQTVFIGASSAGGTAMGLALPLIGQATHHQAYTSAAMIGGWSGFFLGEWLSHSIFDKSEHDKRASNIEFNLPGVAALPLLAASKRLDRTAMRPGEIPPTLTLANLVWKF
jgi:hypothetical protein